MFFFLAIHASLILPVEPKVKYKNTYKVHITNIKFIEGYKTVTLLGVNTLKEKKISNYIRILLFELNDILPLIVSLS